MGIAGSEPFLITAGLLAVLAALVIYGYLEYQVRLLRTTATKLPTGLLFSSRFFTVGTRVETREVVVSARFARHVREGSAADAMKSPRAELAVVLPAVGLVCDVTPDHGGLLGQTNGHCTVTFRTHDGKRLEGLNVAATAPSTVVIDSVPVPVALAFQSFAAQMELWIERVESRIRYDLEMARRKQEEEEAALAAREAAAQRAQDKLNQTGDAAQQALTEAERKARAEQQIAQWRQAAGFKGSSSEMGTDLRGKVQWFIDLDPTGRVILHANNRTFHGSLKGGKITTLAGELELGVRDALWTPKEPQLSNFNIMAGVKPEVRVAWKERLEIVIRSLA